MVSVKNENMKPITNEEMISIQLDILKQFHAFCKENNLRYSLNYGTLIGAIRHKGLIPWDDDVDVAMPRSDFNRLFELYNNDRNPIYKVLNHDIRPEIDTKIGYMIDYRTVVTTCMSSTYLAWKGLHIDIYPIDIMPRGFLKRKLFYYRLRWLAKLIRIKSLNVKVPEGIRSKKRQFAVSVLHALVFWVNLDKTLTKLTQLSQKYNLSDDEIRDDDVASIFCETDKPKLFPAKYYTRFMETNFEGGMYNIIEDYDAYLRTWYGDYMQLPPEEQRVPKRSVIMEYYWKES